MPVDVRSILPVIATDTAAIESAFLSAGTGLSHGLAAFRALTDSLAELSAEVDGGSTASASLSLGRMSQTLRDIAERLPADGRVLTDLLAGNQGMRRRFDDLVGDMRMMVIVSRSARLEAVVSDEQRISLAAFSHTIEHQIGDVQRRIDFCAAEHGKLTALLERSARTHIAFDERFRGRLTALAAELDEALGLIANRREAGLVFMDDAAKRTLGIMQAAGMALVSLQIGDNTRQRLEHVSYALERGEALAAGGDGVTADLLCQLGEAQLRDTVATFGDEASHILDAFATLGREAANLVAASRATYGSGEGTNSSLTEFRIRFAAARDVVGACEASRQAVEHAIGELRAMLDSLDEMLTRLGETSEGLVIVAMNVGLKATRLGSEGRGLITVASELKRLSAQIALHADGLLSTFRTVRRDADHFGPVSGSDIAGSISLEAEAAAILDGLAHCDGRTADVLGLVDRTGRDFDATVTAAAQAFEAVVADTLRLSDAADEIAAIDPVMADDAMAAAAIRTVDDLMLPLYSMAQERDIHAALTGMAPTTDGGAGVEDRAA